MYGLGFSPSISSSSESELSLFEKLNFYVRNKPLFFDSNDNLFSLY